MDSQILQNLRSKLERRINRLQSADVNLFLSASKQFWTFFDHHPIFASQGDVLSKSYPKMKERAARILSGEHIFGDTEVENAALSYYVLRQLIEKCTNPNGIFNPYEFEQTINRIYSSYSGNQMTKSLPDSLRRFKDLFLVPFYEYIDEQINEQKITLSLLLKYKHRSEWFHREQLALIINKSNSRCMEKQLALNLYSYLYDQGLNFQIEPSSITGEIDLIAAQGSNDPLLADAKIFDADERSKTYIRKGFNQIYTYTQQYNEPCGYLVIFRITERDLNFSVSQTFHGIPAVTYNHKTIFLLTIDIHSHEKSVSQRKPLQAITITEDELITAIEDEK